MENTVIYDAIEKLQAKADEIKLAVDEFGEMLEEIQGFTNETNVVVKDILNGRQLSEWIADLAASGKQSATYSNADRMNALIADRDACRNITVSQHIFDWGVAKNKVGTYLNSAIGSVNGVTWSNVTTAMQAFGNANAFSAITRDSVVFSAAVGNQTSRQAMYSNYSVTQDKIKSSSVAINILREKAIVAITHDFDDAPINKNMWLVGFAGSCSNQPYVYKPAGASSTVPYIRESTRLEDNYLEIFASYVSSNNPGCGGQKVYYVDFS